MHSMSNLAALSDNFQARNMNPIQFGNRKSMDTSAGTSPATVTAGIPDSSPASDTFNPGPMIPSQRQYPDSEADPVNANAMRNTVAAAQAFHASLLARDQATAAGRAAAA